MSRALGILLLLLGAWLTTPTVLAHDSADGHATGEPYDSCIASFPDHEDVHYYWEDDVFHCGDARQPSTSTTEPTGPAPVSVPVTPASMPDACPYRPATRSDAVDAVWAYFEDDLTRAEVLCVIRNWRATG